MFSGKKSFYVSLIAALSLTIAGCGDDKSAKSKSALPPKQAVVNLSDSVLPSYVTVSGLGAPEPWGRWSISDRIVLKFGTDLPKKFSLLIDAKAYGPNAGTAIPVIFGDQVKEIKLSADATQTVRLDFSASKVGNTIEITVPKPTAPGSGDSRTLGIALSSVKIEGLP